MAASFGERFQVPAEFPSLLADGRNGRKSGRGFYLYPTRKRGRKRADGQIYKLLGVKPCSHQTLSQVAERCVMMMCNEAVRTLDEQVITQARDGDVGAVFGVGFPPFLGGPFREMDRREVPKVVARLNILMQQYGERFAPCERLVKMQVNDEKFYKNVGEDNNASASAS